MNLESFLTSTLPQLIYSTYKNTPPRPHLGASIIGKPCLREIWYSFRWAKQVPFEGRMLRLFEAGNAFEDRIVRELQAIGITVSGRQDRVTIGPHFSGSIDGIGAGFPESKKPHLLEFKTHNQKSFDTLVKDGVQSSKPEHFIQMNCYMGVPEINLDRAYYIAENKNTSELHAERIHFDKDLFYATKLKASEIIFSGVPCDRIAENPAAFACKWCNYKAVCHGAEKMDVSCRTCQYVTVRSDCFECTKHGGAIPVDFQRLACVDYVPIV